MQRKQKRTLIWVVVAVVIVVAGWFSFGPGLNFGSSKKAQATTVTVGVVGETKQDEKIWDSVAETAKKKYNINLKVKNFTDYNQPNKALKSGSIDLNAFQHYAFLNAWNKSNGGGVVAIGKTYIAPIKLYSKKYKSVKSIPNGAQIAVPNDASNESRALYVLKNAGLIQLKSGKTLATVADITKNPKHLKIKEVSAEQTARVLDSVDASIVNNDYAAAANLSSKYAIYTEPINKDSEQWINVIAAKKGNQNKKAYKDVVKAFQTATTKRLYKKYYGNSLIAAWDVNLK